MIVEQNNKYFADIADVATRYFAKLKKHFEDVNEI